jgi:diguanylate cyclase (GGDEF)-like protein
VIVRQEQFWQASKQDAIRALSLGFADTLDRLKQQLAARDATVNTISEYFENLVSDLRDKADRDAKTNLMNFPRFVDALAVLLATERRGRWVAVGLVDIAHFKWYNDTCGHVVGDQIIQKVSRFLREHVRSGDLIAKERDADGHSLHARFGGDEFCFLIANMDDLHHVMAVCDRFSQAVRRCDWTAVDPRLAERSVRVDIGVAWLRLGPLADRRFLAQRLANRLIEWGDTVMYQAKADPQTPIHVACLQIVRGEIVEVASHAG